MKLVLVALVTIFSLHAFRADCDVDLGDGAWVNPWSQWAGETITGGDSPEQIMQMTMERCNLRRASCVSPKYTDSYTAFVQSRNQWVHCVNFTLQIDNRYPGSSPPYVYLTGGEQACRGCSSSQIIGDADCATIYCPAGYVYEPSNQIESRCVKYRDPFKDNPTQETCASKSDHPIDFFFGRKYRIEPVFRQYSNNIIPLNWYYNNHGNFEKSGNTYVPPLVLRDDISVVSSAEPLLKYEAMYNSAYRSQAESLSGGKFLEQTNSNWRHSYQERIEKIEENLIYFKADGVDVVFTELGVSQAYPEYRLTKLMADDSGHISYQLEDSRSKTQKLFNHKGQLTRIKNSGRKDLFLSYQDDSLYEVRDVFNRWIRFSYIERPVNTENSIISASNFRFVSSVSSSWGESVDFDWSHSYVGDIQNHYLISRIISENFAREFHYGNAQLPASITEIYDVDLPENHANLYAHFSYDNQGRVIVSELAGGQERIQVNYVNETTRSITNALGKTTTWQMAQFNNDGVNRVGSIVGEPAVNCERSDVIYQYDFAGNINRKSRNGQVTEYQYDSRSREISRTEAAGTPDARTITTEYHPTLNLPVRITEPGRVEVMTYDESGRLLSKNIQPTAAPSP